jgi:hypothetical protein
MYSVIAMSKQSDFDAFCWRLDQAKRAIKQVKHKPRIVLLVDYKKAPECHGYVPGHKPCEF